MEKVTENASKAIEKATTSIQNTAKEMADMMVHVLDKLAGTESSIKLSFEDLTIDAGVIKTQLSGAIVLDLVYAKDAETNPKAKPTTTSSQS